MSYLTIPPDILVEVVSPSDTWHNLRLKVNDWLDAGVRVVWVANPETAEVFVYTKTADPVILTAAMDLTCPDVLPGFSVPVATLFPVRAGTPAS
jgi:Uma2 family endonuclease